MINVAEKNNDNVFRTQSNRCGYIVWESRAIETATTLHYDRQENTKTTYTDSGYTESEQPDARTTEQ